jgi:hypothetical protein
MHYDLMNEEHLQRTTLVLADLRDVDGTMWRAVNLTEDGGLALVGHDLGAGVERIFGCSEYEFERRLTAGDTAALRSLLGLEETGDLLTAIEGRFASTPELEVFLKDHGIEGQFWNRIGD